MGGVERSEVGIEKLIAGGMGLGRLDSGEVVMVPHVAPGERVAIELDRTRKPAHGRLLKVLAASPSRVALGCAIADRCGGCDWMHLAPEAQRAAKLDILRAALPTSARDVEPTWHAAAPARGRTRARWHARSLGGGRLVLGYRALGATSIVDAHACPAVDPRVEAALDDARALLANARGEGDVHAAIGAGSRPVLSIAWRGELAATAWREAETRVNQGRLAGVEVTLEGARVPARVGDPRPLSTPADGLPLYAPPAGFSQASDIGSAVLVRTVLSRARAEGARVVELFAGSGNLTVALARVARSVIAVEIVPGACDAARANLATRGYADRAKVVEGDADVFAIPSGTDVVVLDPPRTGARGATAGLASSKVRRAVYVSCDAPTLGRDLAVLLDARFSIESIDAVDLFPDTSHVEAVATLARAPKGS